MNDKKGVIYILTNPSFPGYVKIGYVDDIDKWLKQLNRSECIPFAFRVYAIYEVNSRLQGESEISSCSKWYRSTGGTVGTGNVVDGCCKTHIWKEIFDCRLQIAVTKDL